MAKVAPISSRPVKPMDPNGMVRLSENEIECFDMYAQEHVRTIGTQVDFFSLSLTKSKRDAVYDEPTVRKWDGPFRIFTFVIWPNQIPEAREEGIRFVFSGAAWVSRKELEDAHAPNPKPGDIVKFWNIPYFDASAAGGTAVTGSGYYFDVLDAKDDGHLFDNASFVGFTMTLKRRTEFSPERKLSG